tara:strand:- start:742 stop:843 length:102 start_codon:yes stop_codon:yes gene_type:complete
MPIVNEVKYHDSGSGITHIITTYEDGEEIIVEE